MDTNLNEIGRNAYESIVDMVAALECDYSRLDDLREARDNWEQDENDNGEPTGPATWADANPSDAEELAELEEAAGDCADEDEARERIHEDALSIEVRSGWAEPGAPLTPEEFNILLTTGGPAVRIIGELNEYGEPDRAWLEVQDWGTPWTQYHPASPDTLLAYARCFCFAD